MKQVRLGIVMLAITAVFVACSGTFALYEEKNPNGFTQIALSNVASGGNLYRLSFGTSAGASSGDGTGGGMTIWDDGSEIRLRATNSGASMGKIAGSEDGIAFYFKEVDASKNFRLSADVEVVSFGFTNLASPPKTDLNGQEGFGIMARDYVPQYPGKNYAEGDLDGMTEYNNYYAGSTGGTGNMIMVGGVKRGMRTYWRTGVTDPSGGAAITDTSIIANADMAIFSFQPREIPDYSSYDAQWNGVTNAERFNARPDFPNAGTKYNLLLEKTNNGFNVRITPLSAGKSVGWANDANGNPVMHTGAWEYTVAEPDLLFSINKEHYYVGFFACRDAEAKLTNVQYFEADTDDCAPAVEAEIPLITPTFEVTSPATASTAAYTLYATANVEGAIGVKVNGKALPNQVGAWKVEATNASAVPLSLFEVKDIPLVDGDNVFQILFTPNAEQSKSGYLLANSNTIAKNFIVSKKSFGNTIYVSADGRSFNTGTSASPLDIATAIAYVQPGGEIVLKDGTYKLLSVEIPRYNSGIYTGAADADVTTGEAATTYKTLRAETRYGAIIDFDKNKDAKGFVLSGDAWKISGIRVINTPNKVKGLTVMGSRNIVEWVKTYNNGDTGLQIAGKSTEPKAMWPSYNLIRNCESFSNMDNAREDADGFASKLTSGKGIVFYQCIAHHNVDDGWDLFSKKETGPIGEVLLDHCIAYSNGKYLDGDATTNSGGNGFKMGGEGISVKHKAVDCLSFDNDAEGYTSNSDPSIILERCTAFNNKGDNFAVYTSGTGAIDAEIKGLLSLHSSTHNGDDRFTYGSDSPKKSLWLSNANGYVWSGNKSVNKSGSVLTVANLVNAIAPYVTTAPFDSSVSGNFIGRNESDGTFVLNGFLKLNGFVGPEPGAQGMW
jgi:hypothetical protein